MKRTPMQRDFVRVRNLSLAMLEQCRHHGKIVRRGENDDLRAVVVNNLATTLLRTTERMARRWRKTRAERERAGEATR